jgi:DNA mismatch repair protein MutS2
LIQAETLELLEWSRLCQHVSTFAATKLGTIAARHLQIPATLAETQELLAQTQEVYNLENRLLTGLSFEGIQDIGDALERAERGGLLSGQSLFAIATTLAGTRNLRRTIADQPDCPTLTAVVADLRTYPELEQNIYHCIDDRGDVNDRASPPLASIREQIRQRRDQVYGMLHRLLQRHSNAVQEALITQRGERFVIPVKATHKDVVPGIVHDTSMSGATLYVEPHATVNANNQLRQLQRQEEREVEAVLRALTDQVAAVKPDLEKLLAIATTLDLATARARYSLWLAANPPHFLTASETTAVPSQNAMTFRQLRHPLLVWQHQHEQGQPVVPIDVLISPRIRVVAITGPNTGGKTVTLKTLGLAVLMAKVGLFVPAREPVELPWFDQVLADIGDEQSIEQSLSTFSGHIRRIVRILEVVRKSDGRGQTAEGNTNLEGTETGRQRDRETRRQGDTETDLASPSSPSPPLPLSASSSQSLVLLDEVGAGTDPTEGSALAAALLQYLADQVRLTIATTHFGELKALKYEDDRFENASVEFDDVSLSPTYRLLWGIPGRSNALTIAGRLGLDPEIIQQAQQRVGGFSEAINQVIAGLEAQRRQQEQKAQAAGQLLAQTEHLHQELSARAAQVQERERQLQLAQEQAVQQAILQAKQDIAQVIRQLQRGTPTAQDAQQATTALGEIAQRYLPSRQPAPQPPPGFHPQVGDRIRIPRLGQTAEVLSAANTDGELTVRLGLMKMTVTLADIESLSGQKPTLPEKPALTKSSPPKSSKPPEPAPEPVTLTLRTSQNTLDLRGSRVADAELELDRALAEADGVLWIIHGHGTGRLRQGIHEFLQQHPKVRGFHLAEPSDGGAGVTIVELL